MSDGPASGEDTGLPRGTVTFLFTDIEESTELLRGLGTEYGGVRMGHGRLIEEACAANGGHVIDTQGEAYFAAFDRAADAVATAVDVQRKLAAVDWPEGLQLRVRMGLHTAEPYLDDSGYFGLGVHRAARICAAAHGGQILVSNATAGIVEDLESGEFELRDLGEFRLKDIALPQRLFELRVQGLDREFAPPKGLDDPGAHDPYGRVGTLFGTHDRLRAHDPGARRRRDCRDRLPPPRDREGVRGGSRRYDDRGRGRQRVRRFRERTCCGGMCGIGS